jgi:hypothetical protein
MRMTTITTLFVLGNRFKIDYGKAWEHIGGDVFGQTQIAYSQDKICMNGGSACIALNHPLDLHFASAGLQVF